MHHEGGGASRRVAVHLYGVQSDRHGYVLFLLRGATVSQSHCPAALCASLQATALQWLLQPLLPPARP